MPVKATPFIKLLQSVLQKPIDERLDQVKSIIPSVEKGAIKNTEPLTRELIRVLTSVVRSSDTTAEQLTLAAEYRARVDTFDPRNPDNDRPRAAKDAESRPISKPSASKVPDGYDEHFLNFADAAARVIARYGDCPPSYTPLENERLLQSFLGDIALDEKSATQIWLHLAAEFIARGGSIVKKFTELFPPITVAVQTALCQFVNSRHISVPTPNCLPDFFVELAFRN